ncbi:camphor resistance protein CrcB [Halomarina oriensis]|uniref:Fluoride-specific ion channel FluC n=1 Tax=Halomarina oriensis TaxID=671145 RepID=A0A6B0GLF9_9EURY|nr:camphor resistance protein CrcB [Halomarina oriensis]
MLPASALVGVGGVVGALARYAVGERVERDYLDTLLVNVLGSFLLGVLLAVPRDGTTVLLVGVGGCGAFTTFSAAAVETVDLAATGRRRALLALGAMVGGCLLAAGAGAAVGGGL